MPAVVLVESTDVPEDEWDDRAERSASGGLDHRAPSGAVGSSVLGARRRRWAAGLVLVAAVVGVNVVSAAQERERAEHLATVPGILRPLTAPLVPVWERPYEWRVHTGGGELLVGEPGPDGDVDVVSIDPATGEARWRTAIPEAAESGGSSLTLLGDEHAGTSGHAVVRILDPGPAADSVGWIPSLRALVIVLDTRTGARVAERARGATSTIALGSVGEDLVVAELLPDGRARVHRESTATGEPLWTFVSAAPVAAQEILPEPLHVEVQRGVVVVTGPSSYALDPSDGRLLREWTPPAGEADAPGRRHEITVLADGRFVVGRTGPFGPTAEDDGTVSAGGGHDGFPVRGAVLRLGVDDRSAADVLLTVPVGPGAIAAYDATSGEPLWTREGRPADAPVLLDGRLFALVRSHVEAIDVRSGRLVWRSPELAVRETATVLTDGQAVIVPTIATGPRTLLTAFDLADGSELWSAPLPGQMVEVQAVDGRLVAQGETSIMAFGSG